MTEAEEAAWCAERKREWEAEVAAAGGLEAWRNLPGEWVQRHEYIAHYSPHCRFRTIIEFNEFKRGLTMQRNEEADEQGIDWSAQDDERFAKELMDGLFWPDISGTDGGDSGCAHRLGPVARRAGGGIQGKPRTIRDRAAGAAVTFSLLRCGKVRMQNISALWIKVRKTAYAVRGTVTDRTRL